MKRDLLTRRPGPHSRGERHLMIGYVTTGLFGAALAMIVLMRLDGTMIVDRAMTVYECWVAASGLIGAMVGLHLLRGRLGRAGILSPVLGIAGASFVGALIAGTLALPGYGTMFGPFTMGIIFVASPLTAVVWIVNLSAVHVALRRWHAERDSVFTALHPDRTAD